MTLAYSQRGSERPTDVVASAFVSIIVPCRNEEKFIGACLDSIISNDYPKDRLEILVLDGMSEDRTRVIIQNHTERYPFIRLVDNCRMSIPAALNLGVDSAQGEIVMRMDAHTTYDRQYISRCIRALDQYGPENVGGIWRVVPQSDGLIGQAIAKALSHKFGVGNAQYRVTDSDQPRWVDTVPFFCCRKETLAKAGPFNEAILRSEDMDFSLRLKRAGGRVLLVPQIVSYYHARSDVKSFLRHNWVNGVWAVMPFLHSHGSPVALRHLVPLAFFASLLVSGAGAFLWSPMKWVFFAISGAYGMASLLASAQVATKGNAIRLLFLMPAVFGGLHLSYGFGSFCGLAKALAHLVWRCKKGPNDPDGEAGHEPAKELHPRRIEIDSTEALQK
jgi:glycosyltransferase involved in cell wall biosynthesis